MTDKQDPASFFTENKDLVKEYIETRIEILRLSAIRVASKSAGFLIWMVISLFLFFLILLFGGLVLGFWLSGLTGSFVEGFGLSTLILLLIFSLLAAFRRSLFINPIVQAIIGRATEDRQTTDSDE